MFYTGHHAHIYAYVTIPLYADSVPLIIDIYSWIHSYFCKTHLQTNTNPLTGHGNPFIHLIKQAQAITAESGIRGLSEYCIEINRNFNSFIIICVGKCIGLYRGYLWSTLGSFPGIITHVSVYTTAKYQLSYNELNSTHNLFSHSMDTDKDSIKDSNIEHLNESPIPQSLIPLVSGLIAESVAVFAYVPQEVVAQRLQLAPKDVRLFEIIKSIYHEQGIQSFWRGTMAAYASYLPSSGIWWGSYEAYKHLICKEKSRQNLLGYSVAGVCGGVTTALLTNPIDIIRTRIQTQRGTYGSTKILPVIGRLYKNEGILAFSKGLGARISLLVLEGILFADFYEIMMYFSKINKT